MTSVNSKTWDRVGTVFCGVLLTALNGVLLFALFAMLVGWFFSGGEGEYGDVTLLLVLCALVVAGLTWVFVKAEWLRSWWYALPALSGAIALLLRLAL
ncbi:hypothetical protein [Streptomyces sp. NPDC002851]